MKGYFASIAVILLISALFPLWGHFFESPLVYEYEQFKKWFMKSYVPLYKNMTTAYWNASITGKPEDWARAELAVTRLNEFFSNTTSFAFLEKVRSSGVIVNETSKRELEVIYLSYKGNQADVNLLNAIANISSSIERRFNTYRTNWEGKNLTDNQVLEILNNSTNSTVLKSIWTAQKRVGSIVAADIVKLVHLRNQVAHKLGYTNYHNMSLSLSEQNPNDISSLFDLLDQQTRPAFITLKEEIDKFLSGRYNLSIGELQPWHYQDLFFQRPPKIYSLNFDHYYKNLSLEMVTSQFYQSIGLPIDDLLAKSDLYSKPGKSQHAMCIDLDNEGDIRVLSNNVNNSKWMGVMLHEFGHAAYDKFIYSWLPFVLREPAHIFTTEAIAMLFQRSSQNPHFIKHFYPLTEESVNEMVNSKDAKKAFAMDRIVFSRWAQVMYRFERSLYENPDQDLDELWWEIVEKYQFIKKPKERKAPDWATKIHFSIAPCYYHNYMLGELLASQLNHYICTNVIKEKDVLNPKYYGKENVGIYLKEAVFGPGRLYKWDENIKRATDEDLTPEFYAKEIELCLS